MQLRLDRYGHIIGTEYLSDLVEKGHGAHHDHGILLFLPKKEKKTNLAWNHDNYHMKEFYQQYACIFCILLDVGEYLLLL